MPGSDAPGEGLTVAPKYALLSVSDKTDLPAFGKAIAEAGYTILSTGGTARVLKEAGVPVTKVSAHTGAPEIFNGQPSENVSMALRYMFGDTDVLATIKALQEDGFVRVLAEPNVVASKQTHIGGDGGWVRRCGTLTSATAVGFTIDEDVYSDTERAHTGEDVGFLAFSVDFDTTLQDPTARVRIVFGDGTVRTDRTWKLSQLRPE